MNVYGLYQDLHWAVQGAVHGLAEAPLMKHACEVFLTLEPFADASNQRLFDLARQRMNGWPVDHDMVADAAVAVERAAKRKLNEAQRSILKAAFHFAAALETFDGIWGIADQAIEIELCRWTIIGGKRPPEEQTVKQRGLAIIQEAIIQALFDTALKHRGERGRAIAELLRLEDPSGVLLAQAVTSVLKDKNSKALSGLRL